MAGIKDLERKRAEYAYKYADDGISIKVALKLKESELFYAGDKYSSYVDSIITYIRVNGLSATLAFMLTKCKKNNDGKSEDTAKNEYDLLLFQFDDWLKQCEHIDFYNKEDNKDKDIIQKVLGLDSIEYKQITKELLALLKWLRRFAKGLNGSDDPKGEDYAKEKK